MTQPTPRDHIENLWDRATPVGPLLDAYRAAVLDEAADEAERENADCPPLTASPCQPCAVRTAVATKFRRMAEEARS